MINAGLICVCGMLCSYGYGYGCGRDCSCDLFRLFPGDWWFGGCFWVLLISQQLLYMIMCERGFMHVYALKTVDTRVFGGRSSFCYGVVQLLSYPVVTHA